MATWLRMQVLYSIFNYDIPWMLGRKRGCLPRGWLRRPDDLLGVDTPTLADPGQEARALGAVGLRAAPQAAGARWEALPHGDAAALREPHPAGQGAAQRDQFEWQG